MINNTGNCRIPVKYNFYRTPVKKIAEILLGLVVLDKLSYFLISNPIRDHLPARRLMVHFSENLSDCQVSVEIKSCFAVNLENRKQYLKDRK